MALIDLPDPLPFIQKNDAYGHNFVVCTGNSQCDKLPDMQRTLVPICGMLGARSSHNVDYMHVSLQACTRMSVSI